MKHFFKQIISKIKKLDKEINTYKENTNSISMPSKAYLNWGIHLAIEGKIDDAIKKFEMSSEMSITDPESFMNWGIALAKQRNFKEAIKKFNEALKIDKTYASAYSLKGAALIELNEIDDALDCYKVAVKYAPFEPEIYVNWGVALARTGEKIKAEGKFKKALSLSSKNVNAAFLLGVVLYEQNKLQEALEAFNYAVTLSSTHAMAFYYLSLTNTKLKKYDDALQCALISVQLIPFKIDFMVNLAECYYDIKDVKSVIKTYKAVELIAPDEYSLLISAGIFWQKVKKYNKSLKYLEKAVEKPQADYLTEYYLGITYAGLNENEKAKELFQKVVNKKSDFYDATIKLAILAKMDGNYTEAIELLETVFLNTTKFTNFYSLAGDCYNLKGDIDKALVYYKKMLEYHPNDIEASIQLSQIFYIHLNDIKNALRMIRAAYKMDSESVKINALYALILCADKSFDIALEKINKAIELEPENIDLVLKKLLILKKAQYNKQFDEYFSNILEKFKDKTDFITEQVAELKV